MFDGMKSRTYFEAQDFGLDEGKWAAVHFDEAFACFAVCDGGC